MKGAYFALCYTTTILCTMSLQSTLSSRPWHRLVSPLTVLTSRARSPGHLMSLCLVLSMVAFFTLLYRLATRDDRSNIEDIPHPLSALQCSGHVSDMSHTFTLDDIQRMVKGTKGFLTRDYSLGLGWNNVRLVPSVSAFSTLLSLIHLRRVSLHADAVYY